MAGPFVFRLETPAFQPVFFAIISGREYPLRLHLSQATPSACMKDYYHILQVNQQASPEVIDRAYKTLVRKYHPDRYTPEKKAWANARMQEINEARAVLIDPDRRAEYSRQRRVESWRVFWREGLTGLSRLWSGR